MGVPGGSYGHVQWNNSGGNFGGEANFWYNGSLHVAMTNDVGANYKIQSGESIYTAQQLYVGENVHVVRNIRQENRVAGSIFPMWSYSATPPSTLSSNTAANQRTALNAYSTSEVYTRAEGDSRYQRSAFMSSYYRKTETLPRTNVYARSEVYTRAEINALLAGYIARSVFSSYLTSYAKAPGVLDVTGHIHTISISTSDVHDHNGDTTPESGHSHTSATSGARY